MSGGLVRACRCGTPLARDNPGPLCSPCRIDARDRRRTAPVVEAGFWAEQQMAAALSSWHMGRVITAYRTHPDHLMSLTQEIVAGWMGLTQAQLSRIERGPQPKDLDRLVQWARVLRIPAHLLWFKLPDDPARGSLPTPQQRPERSADTRTPSAPGSAPVCGPRPRAQSSATGHAAAMRSFRAADLSVGGGHLYLSVVGYLHASVGPDLFAGGDEQDPRAAFTAGAGLTEMAGWMAHDAGQDDLARQHFARAGQLAQVGADTQLLAHVYASMSHLAAHRGHCQDAVALALRGQETLKQGPTHPHLEARLLAMQARGMAGLREPRHSARLLVMAELALDQEATEPASAWTSSFDIGSLASEAARCLWQTGDVAQTRRQAECIIDLRPAERARSRAFGQIILAKTLVAQNQLDHARALAREVLATTRALSSQLVLHQLHDLRACFDQPPATSAADIDFLAEFDHELSQRLSPHWTTRLDASGASA